MREPAEIRRDLFVACFHPEYRERDTLDALRELKARRTA